jgi:hypothetical protein
VLVSGLGEVGGALYSVSFGGDTLYQVDPTDGALSSIGTSGINYFELGSTLTTLYAIDSSGDLDSVNPSTGAATLIGSTGLSLGGDWTLSSNSSTLYFTDFAGGAENLYTLNTTTGLAILIGPTGGPEYGGLMWDGISVLYGGEVLPGQTVDTLNTSTGLATVGPSLTGTGDFYGLAPLLAAPEPATWSLLGAGIAILALMKRRRQRARLTCGTSN